MMKGLLLWLWLAQGADITTTAIGLNRGCVERTYWSSNPYLIGAAKGGSTVFFSFTLPNMKPRKLAKGIAIGFAAGTTVAAIHNARVIRGGC
jgi:hypothetical protein